MIEDDDSSSREASIRRFDTPMLPVSMRLPFDFELMRGNALLSSPVLSLGNLRIHRHRPYSTFPFPMGTES